MLIAAFLLAPTLIPAAADASSSYRLVVTNGQGPTGQEFRLGDTVFATVKVLAGSSSAVVLKQLRVYDAFTQAFLGTYDAEEPVVTVPPFTSRNVVIPWPHSTFETGVLPAGRYRIEHVPILGDGPATSTVVDVGYAPDFELRRLIVTGTGTTAGQLKDPFAKRFLVCVENAGTEPVTEIPLRIRYSIAGDPPGSAGRVAVNGTFPVSPMLRCTQTYGGGFYLEIPWNPTVDELAGGAALARDAHVVADPWNLIWELDETNNDRWAPASAATLP